MVTLRTGEIPRFCITLKSPRGEDPSAHAGLLDGVDGIIHRHSDVGIYRDGLNRWYVPYGIDASLAMPDLLAMGRALARSAKVRAAGLEVYWDEPGYPAERL